MKRNKASELKRRVAALSVLVFFVLAMSFSAFFVVKESNHECHGPACPICETIHQCEQNIRSLYNVQFFVALVATILCVVLSAPAVFPFWAATSLISQKVRLNN